MFLVSPASVSVVSHALPFANGHVDCPWRFGRVQILPVLGASKPWATAYGSIEHAKAALCKQEACRYLSFIPLCFLPFLSNMKINPDGCLGLKYRSTARCQHGHAGHAINFPPRERLVEHRSNGSIYDIVSEMKIMVAKHK